MFSRSLIFISVIAILSIGAVFFYHFWMVQKQEKENIVANPIRAEIEKIPFTLQSLKKITLSQFDNYLDYFKRLKFAYKEIDYNNIFIHKIAVKNQKEKYISLQHYPIKNHEKNKQKNTVILIHGLGMHTASFAYLISYLIQKKIEVYAFDLPYHGLSYGKGKFGQIKNFQEYFDATEFVFNHVKKYSNNKITFIAHSTGCTVVLGFLNQLKKKERKFISHNIFLAPLVKHENNDFSKFIFPVVSPLLRRLSTGRAKNIADEDFRKFREKDILTPLTFSLNWLKQLYFWQKKFNSYKKIDVPTTIFQGEKDKVVEWRFNLPAIASKYPKAKIQYFKNVGHSLPYAREEIRTSVYKEIEKILFEKKKF